VIRFVTAKFKVATHRLRNRIRRMGASRVARSDMTHVTIIGCRRTSLEHSVLRLGLLEDENVGVGVFPEREATQRLPIPAQLISPEPARSGLHR
jgi:hypothetical protein